MKTLSPAQLNILLHRSYRLEQLDCNLALWSWELCVICVNAFQLSRRWANGLVATLDTWWEILNDSLFRPWNCWRRRSSRRLACRWAPAIACAESWKLFRAESWFLVQAWWTPARRNLSTLSQVSRSNSVKTSLSPHSNSCDTLHLDRSTKSLEWIRSRSRSTKEIVRGSSTQAESVVARELKLQKVTFDKFKMNWLM